MLTQVVKLCKHTRKESRQNILKLVKDVLVKEVKAMLPEIIKTVLEEVSVANNKVIDELITPNTPSQLAEETGGRGASQKADEVTENNMKGVAKESRATGHENNEECSNKNHEEDTDEEEESISDKDNKNGSNGEFQPEEEGNLITQEEENDKPKT
eukprot:10978949-Ditylum_brightwellii.AAC.1